jgi:hypothetical protein
LEERRRDMSLALPDVTLFAVTSVALDATVGALRASMAEASFGQAMLFSDREPRGVRDSGIEYFPIDVIRSKADYSRFILFELGKYVTTTHALCVQWDGFVLNGGAWDRQFLEFDYVGAPWPHFSDHHKVGNGGFSLRSKRLLAATATLPYDGTVPEDVLIGRLYRDQLEAQGIRFAPEELAKSFSYERTARTGLEFGFHGAFNLPHLLSAEQLFSVLDGLEPHVLTTNEQKELLRTAIRKGYPKVAALLIGRILQRRIKKSDARL